MDQASFLEKEFIKDSLSLTFIGKATENHTMDVQWYAQSLIGFNESFIRLNRELFGIEVAIEIVAEKEGSLLANLKYIGKSAFLGVGLYASLLTIDVHHDQIISKTMSSAYVYVIDLFKESKGDPNLLKKMLSNLHLTDEERKRLQKLLKNLDFKLSLDDMTLFLEQNGLDKVIIDGGDNINTVITEFDRPSFKVHPEDLLTTEEIDDILSVIAIGNHLEWKFERQKKRKKITAKILDTDFLQEIKQHPADNIFKMKFDAHIIKTSVIKAGNRKPSPPTYEIDNLKVVNTPRNLPVR